MSLWTAESWDQLSVEDQKTAVFWAKRIEEQENIPMLETLGKAGQSQRKTIRGAVLQLLRLFPNDYKTLIEAIHCLLWANGRVRLVGDPPDDPEFDPSHPTRQRLQLLSDAEIKKGEEVLRKLQDEDPAEAAVQLGHVACSRAHRCRQMAEHLLSPAKEAKRSEAKDHEFDALRAWSQMRGDGYRFIKDLSPLKGLPQTVVAKRKAEENNNQESNGEEDDYNDQDDQDEQQQEEEDQPRKRVRRQKPA